MFDMVTEIIRITSDGGSGRVLNPGDIDRFREKVKQKLDIRWQLDQFSCLEMSRDEILFVQTFKK